jgi:hypothetical protein
MARQDALRRLRRQAVYSLAASTLTLWLAACFASVALAAGEKPSGSPDGSLGVSAGPIALVSGWMPGDSGVIQVVELRATVETRYQMRLEYSGSQNLAEILVITITDSSGTELYRGPLAGAAVGGASASSEADPVLADGQTEVISITATLPLDASRETAGTSLDFTTVVSSSPVE